MKEEADSLSKSHEQTKMQKNSPNKKNTVDTKLQLNTR
jgi:hypothetical protein